MAKSKFDLMLEEITGLPIETLRKTPIGNMPKGMRMVSRFPDIGRGHYLRDRILTPEECDRQAAEARNLPR